MTMNEQNILQTPTIPPQPTETKKKPLLIALLSLGLLIILSGAVFVGIQIGKRQKIQTPSEILFNQPTIQATPTTDPTAGWKTYTNSQIGYQLRYPQNWNYKERSDTNADQEVWFGTQNSENIVTLYVEKNNHLGLVSDGGKLITCRELSTKYEKLGEKTYTTTVGGFSATEIFLPGGQNPAQDIICFEKDKKAYEFQHFYDTTIDSKVIFDQILATFKFLE